MPERMQIKWCEWRNFENHGKNHTDATRAVLKIHTLCDSATFCNNLRHVVTAHVSNTTARKLAHTFSHGKMQQPFDESCTTRCIKITGKEETCATWRVSVESVDNNFVGYKRFFDILVNIV